VSGEQINKSGLPKIELLIQFTQTFYINALSFLINNSKWHPDNKAFLTTFKIIIIIIIIVIL